MGTSEVNPRYRALIVYPGGVFLMLNATENGKIYADMDHMLQTLRIAVHYLCNRLTSC